MEKRFEAFIIFILLTIITLGLYIPFFWITRQQETIDLLKDIKEELIAATGFTPVVSLEGTL